MWKPNSLTASLLGALLLVPFGTGGSASACELDDASETGKFSETSKASYSFAESECLSLLRTLRDPLAPGPQEVAKSIESLGVGVLDGLLVVLETRALPNPTDPAERPQALSESQVEAMLTAIELFGRGNAFPVWQLRYGAAIAAADKPAAEPAAESAGEESTPAAPTLSVQAALQALGAFGGTEDLDLIWKLLKLDEQSKTKLSRNLRTSLVEAVLGIMARDQGALAHIQRTWDVLPDPWMGSVIRAIGKNGDPRGNQLLLDLIQFSPNHARLAACQVQVLGPTNDRRFNAELSGSLLKQVDSGTKEDAQAAILAIGVMEDESALPTLIELLGDERPGVATNASHALKGITTMSLHPAADVWKMWFQSETDWIKNERREILARLDGRDPNIVKAALREIGRHRLTRHELAREVAPLLRANNVSVKLEAARVLGELQSRWAASDLVEALRDPSEAVRNGAHAALLRISGRQFGPTPEEWEGMRFP